MKILFSVILIFVQVSQAQEVVGDGATRGFTPEQQLEAETSLSGHISAENLNRAKTINACLNAIDKVGSIQSIDYKGTQQGHFLFHSPNPRTITYLSDVGAYTCSVQWPDRDASYRRDISFTVSGQTVAPYGAAAKNVQLTNKSCQPDSAKLSKMANQAGANITYLAGLWVQRFTQRNGQPQTAEARQIMNNLIKGHMASLRAPCGRLGDFDMDARMNAGLAGNFDSKASVQWHVDLSGNPL